MSDPLFTDGVIVIDKPAGPTSHDVVAVLRRALASARGGEAEGRPYRHARSARVRGAAARDRQGDAPRAVSFIRREGVRRAHRAGRDDHDARSRRRRCRTRSHAGDVGTDGSDDRGRGCRVSRDVSAAASRLLGQEDRRRSRLRSRAQERARAAAARASDGDGARGHRMARHDAAPAPGVLRRILRALAGRCASASVSAQAATWRGSFGRAAAISPWQRRWGSMWSTDGLTRPRRGSSRSRRCCRHCRPSR